MNKRIRDKRIKKKYNYRIDEILNEISKHFKVTSKFYFEGDYIIHFNLKQLADWRFGIWLEKDSFSLIGEHNDLIDKFKSSRTYISFTDINEFIDAVYNIIEYPKSHYVLSLPFSSSYKKLFKNVNEDKYYECMKEKIEEIGLEEMDRKTLFCYVKNLPNRFDQVIASGITDRNINSHGWNFSSRYHITLFTSYSGVSTKDEQDFYRNIHKEIHEINESLKTSKYRLHYDFSPMTTPTRKDKKFLHYFYEKEMI